MLTLKKARRNLDGFMSSHLNGLEGKVHPDMLGATRHIVLGEGHRWRPLFLLGAALLNGVSEKEALPFEAAIEYIHCGSLAHDDHPLMDNSDLRHGKEAVHIKYGGDVAILTLPSLQEWSVNLINQHSSGEKKDLILDARFEACNRTVKGQLDDTRGVMINSEADGIQRYAEKTGALFGVSTYVGAVLGGASPQTRLTLAKFGEAIGIAFQGRDDFYDAVSKNAVLGKPVQQDSAKITPLSVLGQIAVLKIIREHDEIADLYLDSLTGNKRFLRAVIGEMRGLYKDYLPKRYVTPSQ